MRERGRLTLTELTEGVEVEEVRRKMGVEFRVAEDVGIMD
jgi:acyl CoA:acetate/3-ketoacid CoA transferase beta subunit